MEGGFPQKTARRAADARDHRPDGIAGQAGLLDGDVRQIIFQIVEGAVSREVFALILVRINQLLPMPV